MAATDKTFRNQYKLDVVFGASCLLLLAGTVWMLYDDHYRPWKRVQRKFRDVEEALFLQQMLAKAPDATTLADIETAQDAVKAARADLQAEKKALPDHIREVVAARTGKSPPEPVDADAWLKRQALEKAKLEADYQDTKANYDSVVSLYNIAVDDRDTAPAGSSHRKALAAEADARKARANELDAKLKDIQEKLNKNEQLTADVLADQKKAEDRLADRQDRLKKMTNDFDRLAKTAAQKRWKTGDWFRSLPIIDGFASAYRIQQVSLDDLTIEYGSFKNVPRYDRCTTCHLGIDRAAFDRDALAALKLTPEQQKDLQTKHDQAVAFLKKRAKADELLGFDPDDLAGKVPSVDLTPAQIKQYAAHPRLELFVDSNSPHPLQKFGCTACHNGQGSATDFTLASHTPNDIDQKKLWEKEHGWEPFHDWEFPMLPARFTESSCLKCHHQVTDLVTQGSKEEAPKLLKGYNLVRENGCFGCHEISGMKAGKEIGPDLRTEPSPALESLTPEDRARLLADPANPPGTLRKVGPSLRRVSEKTSEDWVRKWINSPRGFRPDTKMPHFYNLSNNAPDVLPADDKDPDRNQKDFPTAEIASIAHYIYTESQAYLNGTDRFHLQNEQRLKELEKLQKDHQISDKQAKELIEVRRRLEQWKVPTPIAVQIVSGDFDRIPDDQLPHPSKDAKDVQKGRELFTQRGCLACHSHAGTEKGAGAVRGEASFGPNLSRTAAKINGDKGWRWLVQWIVNPNVHHPRTRMPITHLTAAEAGQVADWLLSQEVKDKQYQDWNSVVIEPSKDALVDLARVYLKKAPGVNALEVEDVLKNGFSKERAAEPKMALEADEHALEGAVTPDKLMKYVGKKAVSRLGCFGCHDVPGFEFAKPIGTPLNDWGKKDPARLAFEDIDAYLKDHYKVVDERNAKDDQGRPAAGPSDKWAAAAQTDTPPYEKFFADALTSHTREGFLHQKIEEPRSYDYHRDVKWDDRLRMPQFKFAHPVRGAKESDDDFRARASVEEAEAREAVMTFVLGLVAEPMSAKYLNSPPPDRLAEVKGRQVLDKFNCAGCHQVRPGVYDLKLTGGEDGTRAALQKAYRGLLPPISTALSEDHVFPEHDAWAGAQPPAADRVTVHGVPLPAGKGGELRLRLTDALRFVGPPHEDGDKQIAYDPADPTGQKRPRAKAGDTEVLTIPGGSRVSLDPAALAEAPSPPFGGTFANLMVPYLMNSNSILYPSEDGDSKSARAALPPPLVREGEKAQPDWLYDFVRNPFAIRPVTILRMPKFNMSEEDAHAIVNYFAAADKVGNPGIGLTYPYVSVPERQDSYFRDKARQYWKESGREKGLQDRIKGLEERGKAAADELTKAKKAADDAKDDAAKKAAKDNVEKAEAEQKFLGAKLKVLKEFADKPADAADSLYWADAYSLIATKGKSACLDCHSVGAVKSGKEQAPPLELSAARLRPDWTKRWIANPDRLLTYPSPMPQNFGNGRHNFPELFPGSSLEQLTAARDVLMNLPKVADMPVNRTYRKATSGGD